MTKQINLKHLSNMMLLASFLSGLFYATSYPYIYAELIKVVPKLYISLEQIIACLGTMIFCGLWNKYSDKLFQYYHLMLFAEIFADVALFADVLIRKDLKFYFLLNIIIFAVVTKNVICGGTKMRAKVHPKENLREQYDNNLAIVDSIATLGGAGMAMIFTFDLKILFILALTGNIIDNFFYLYIYFKVRNLKEENKNEKLD